jgi:hypothetical protein
LNHHSGISFEEGKLGLIWDPTMYSRDIMHKGQGDHLDRVHPDQKVLEMIRQGMLVLFMSFSSEVKRLKTSLSPLSSNGSRDGQAGG